MIYKRNAHDQACVKYLCGEHAIRIAGENITAWVVVSDERTGHGLAQQGSEDISGADVHPIHLT